MTPADTNLRRHARLDSLATGSLRGDGLVAYLAHLGAEIVPPRRSFEAMQFPAPSPPGRAPPDALVSAVALAAAIPRPGAVPPDAGPAPPARPAPARPGPPARPHPRAGVAPVTRRAHHACARAALMAPADTNLPGRTSISQLARPHRPSEGPGVLADFGWLRGHFSFEPTASCDRASGAGLRSRRKCQRRRHLRIRARGGQSAAEWRARGATSVRAWGSMVDVAVAPQTFARRDLPRAPASDPS